MIKIVLIGIIALALLAFAYWTLSPLFIEKEVEEGLTPEIEQQFQENARGPFPITGTAGHPASGSAYIIEGDEDTLLRLENYVGTNGPDLYVYLATDESATDYVSLGRAKGTRGNMTYQIPDGTDLERYSHILTWCKAFGVLFDSAEISG